MRRCLKCGHNYTGRTCPRPTCRRPSAHRRGYDREHQRARARLAATLPTPCGYGCGKILEPSGRWYAAHVIDGDPSAGWIASCGPCNEQAKRSR